MIIKKIKNKKFSIKIFKLRNQKYVLANSLNSKKISKQSHNKWFDKFIKNNNFFVLLKKKMFVGYIRVNKNNLDTSWAIYKKFWGKVNFYKILKKLTKKNYTATIKQQNVQSLIVALKAGYKIISLYNNKFYLKK
jgi:hypothetical protein